MTPASVPADGPPAHHVRRRACTRPARPARPRPDGGIGVFRQVLAHGLADIGRQHPQRVERRQPRSGGSRRIERRSDDRIQRVARDRRLRGVAERRAARRSRAMFSGARSARAPRASGSARGSPVASNARSIPARTRGAAAGNSCSRCSTARGPITASRAIADSRVTSSSAPSASISCGSRHSTRDWISAIDDRDDGSSGITRLPRSSDRDYRVTLTTRAARRFSRRVSSRALSNFGRSSP